MVNILVMTSESLVSHERVFHDSFDILGSYSLFSNENLVASQDCYLSSLHDVKAKEHWVINVPNKDFPVQLLLPDFVL